MKILVDVNFPPVWVDVFSRHRIDAVHWTSIGDPRAKDSEIMEWARRNGYIVFTHDLDFGALLAMTRASGPSVIQVRTQDVFPIASEALVIAALEKCESALEQGAIVSVDERSSRVRILPIVR